MPRTEILRLDPGNAEAVDSAMLGEIVKARFADEPEPPLIVAV